MVKCAREDDEEEANGENLSMRALDWQFICLNGDCEAEVQG